MTDAALGLFSKLFIPLTIFAGLYLWSVLARVSISSDSANLWHLSPVCAGAFAGLAHAPIAFTRYGEQTFLFAVRDIGGVAMGTVVASLCTAAILYEEDVIQLPDSVDDNSDSR